MFHSQVYAVCAFLELPTERYKTWHTVRQFRTQGDAFMFRDLIQSSVKVRQQVDGWVRTADPTKVVKCMICEPNKDKPITMRQEAI